MKELKIYYAVNKSGQSVVFVSRPERNEHFNIWMGDMNAAVTHFIYCLETTFGYELPNISWKDEPVELKISISKNG